jgi:transcriptional regulator with XRE-family HTH domain
MEHEQRGRRLRARRKSAGLTQHALAKRAKMSITYLSELENGKKEGRLRIWHALADALMVDFVNLYTGAPDVSAPDSLPLVGTASGDPDTKFEWDVTDSPEEEESLALPEVKAIRVRGHSMDPVARDGQYALFTEDWPEDGDLCVCAIRDRVYFKRLYVSGNIVTLQSIAGDRPLTVKRSEIAWAYRVTGILFL